MMIIIILLLPGSLIYWVGLGKKCNEMTLRSHSLPGHLSDEYPRNQVKLLTWENGDRTGYQLPTWKMKENPQVQEVPEKQQQQEKIEIVWGQMNGRKKFRGEISEHKEEPYILHIYFLVSNRPLTGDESEKWKSLSLVWLFETPWTV